MWHFWHFYPLSSQNFVKCQTFSGAKSAKSAFDHPPKYSMISPTMTLVSPSPTVRTVPALVLLPALFHLYLVAFQQELLHCMSTPLLSKLLNSGTVCPKRLWTKMLLLYQHSRVHLALSLIRFQICHPLVSQE